MACLRACLILMCPDRGCPTTVSTGADGSTGPFALFAMCAVFVLAGSIRTAHPAGTTTCTVPIPHDASSVTSRCRQVALVKSIRMLSILESATMRGGTTHGPACLIADMCVFNTNVSAPGPRTAGRSATRASHFAYVLDAYARSSRSSNSARSIRPSPRPCATVPTPPPGHGPPPWPAFRPRTPRHSRCRPCRPRSSRSPPNS